MNNISLKKVQAVINRLPEQISFLRKIKEELEIMETCLKEDEVTYPIYKNINKSCKEIEEELRVLMQMQECLNNILAISQDTERKITEIYNMETILYPKTQFGISKISGLQHHKKLMPFSLVANGDEV